MKVSDYIKKVKLVRERATVSRGKVISVPITEQIQIFHSTEKAIEYCNIHKQIILNKKKISLKGKTVYVDRKHGIPVTEIKKFNKGIKITNVKKDAEYFFVDMQVGDTWSRKMEPEVVYYDAASDIYYEEETKNTKEIEILVVDCLSYDINCAKKLASDKYLNPLQYICGDEIMTDEAFSRIHNMLRTSTDISLVQLATSLLPTYDIMKNLTKISLLCKYLRREDIEDVIWDDTSDEFDEKFDKFPESRYGAYYVNNLIAGGEDSFSTYMLERTSIFKEDDGMDDSFCKYLVDLYRNGNPEDRGCIQLVLNDAISTKLDGIKGIQVNVI